MRTHDFICRSCGAHFELPDAEACCGSRRCPRCESDEVNETPESFLRNLGAGPGGYPASCGRYG